jgi:hypothetical protein
MMAKRPPKPKRKIVKSGRPAERLRITEDPQIALDKLLKKKPTN